MIPLNKPYFITNKEWYIFDEELGRYQLTDKATEAAKKSYREFYEWVEDRPTT